jgi:hypothetical protein
LPHQWLREMINIDELTKMHSGTNQPLWHMPPCSFIHAPFAFWFLCELTNTKHVPPARILACKMNLKLFFNQNELKTNSNKTSCSWNLSQHLFISFLVICINYSLYHRYHPISKIPGDLHEQKGANATGCVHMHQTCSRQHETATAWDRTSMVSKFTLALVSPLYQ